MDYLGFGSADHEPRGTMTLILLAIGGLALGLLGWAVAGSAAVADRREADTVLDRRVGREDRRSTARPWTSSAPGRRAEDLLRHAELADAARAFDEEKKLSDVESRESA